jgi:hypothetical protein
MTDDARTNTLETAVEQLSDRRKAKPPLLKLPGLVAISIYMVLLAGTTVAFVMNRHMGLLYLIFPVLFIAGALGLLMLLRWAWALTLAAVAHSSASFLFEFSSQHSFPSLMQGLLNLVFFLYLVRGDVRENLK